MALSVFTLFCRHRHNFQNFSIIPNRNPVYLVNNNSPYFPPWLLVTLILLFIFKTFSILDTSYKWNQIYLSFCISLISLRKMLSRFTHVACIKSSFLYGGINSILCTYYLLSMHQFVRQVGCLLLLNNEQWCYGHLCTLSVFSSFVYISKCICQGCPEKRKQIIYV